MGVKNFKSLLISIPKFIELNSELVLGLGSHPGPRPRLFFGGKMSENVFICYHEEMATIFESGLKRQVDNGLLSPI